MSKCKDFRNHFARQVEAISEFFGIEPNDDEELKASVRTEIRESQARHEKLQALYAELDEVGVGMIVANESGDLYALILPDASEPGRFRYSGFKAIGWDTHFTANTLDEVVLEAFKAGYTCVAARDTLDKMSATTEWIKGCERLAQIQAHQNGKLSWNEMLNEFEKIEATYAQQLLAA
jgi:hypothetical protein